MDIRDEPALVERAAAGDRPALEQLLLAYHDRLAARVMRKLPADLRRGIAAEDVLQEAYVGAFQHIRQFTPRGGDSFYRWLATIADHRLMDFIKHRRAAKRGGRRGAGGRGGVSTTGVAAAGEVHGSIARLLSELAVNERTPSRSAAGREAASAVQAALDGLKPDYREALRLRYVDGLSVAEAARRMGRTERAVHMLCYRGLAAMREVFGGSTRFLSRRS